MKTLLTVAVSVLWFGCAGIPLADEELRKSQVRLPTSVSAKTAYLRSIAWIDKNLLPLEGSEMEQLAPEGRIALRTRSKCTALSPGQQTDDRYLTYGFLLVALDKGVDITFDDIRMVDEDGEPVMAPAEQLSSEEQVQKIQPCLKAITASLLKGIKQQKINWE